MKLSYYRLFIGLILLAPLSHMYGKEITVSGMVRDKNNNKVLESVSLVVKGTNIGTVSNADGSFSLTFSDSLLNNGILAEQIGYKSLSINGRPLTLSPVVFKLEPTAKIINEVTVYGANPRTLIEHAINKIPVN